MVAQKSIKIIKSVLYCNRAIWYWNVLMRGITKEILGSSFLKVSAEGGNGAAMALTFR